MNEEKAPTLIVDDPAEIWASHGSGWDIQPPSTILIVDDQLSAREVLRELLAEQGHNLAFAGNGEEAWTKAAELMPDLILLDVMMPGMDGFEVCSRLRADPQLAEVPIIMITALDDHDARLQGIEAGADDFISKPFDLMELEARVRSITRLNRYRHLLIERTQRQQAESEVRRRNYELTLLNQVIIAVASTLNVQDILRIACKSLINAFEMPHATAWLAGGEHPQFINVDEYVTPLAALERAKLDADRQPDQDDDLGGLIFLADMLLEHLSAAQAPLAIVDEPADPRLVQFYELMQTYHLNSLLIVPILVGDRIVGIIELGSIERRQFSNQDLTLAQSIAIAIGQAMEAAQLYQDLQAHADNLEKTVAERTRELQSERDRTRAILEALGDAVAVTDVSGTIQYLNPAAVTLTGFTEEEAKGQNWRIWQSSKTRERGGDGAEKQLYDEILGVVRAGQTWRGEVSNKRKDGALYDAMLTVAPLFDPHNPDLIIGFVSVQSDITPLKEAERIRSQHQEREKQAALDRLRHTFLSAVNHEMRTPLALIFQTIEMLEDSQLGGLAPQQLDALMVLRRQSKILGKMVESLTRVAAFLSKQKTVRPVWAQLEPVFNNVIPLAEFKARGKEITVETEIAPKLPSFPLDVKQMEEALIQLIDNAIKFNRSGGKVKISAQADDDWVIIAVSDTGIGIEPEQMNRIWEVLEQKADPVRRAQEGLGLGLVLARYIVEAHRGTIEVESMLGQGSTFSVKLPRTKAKKVRESSP
jgi:PAS domain S-box-containing protein